VLSTSSVEVHRNGVLPFIVAFEKFPRLAHRILVQHGICVDDGKGGVSFVGEWFSLRDWLATLGSIKREIGPNALYKCGESIMANAAFPPDLRDVQAALASIDIAYHAMHRLGGRPTLDPKEATTLEGIGHYAVAQASLPDRRIEMIVDTPYDCTAEVGMVLGMAKRFEPRATISHAPGCRMEGAPRCTFVVEW